MSITVVDRIPTPAQGAVSIVFLVTATRWPRASRYRREFDGPLDLNDHLIRDKTSTFIVRVSGESVSGISGGDELVVDDRSHRLTAASSSQFWTES